MIVNKVNETRENLYQKTKAAGKQFLINKKISYIFSSRSYRTN